jgi:hypothetical protein
MNFVQSPPVESAIAVAESPVELSAIHAPDCAAAIWPRQPLESFQAWIDALAPEQLPKARTILHPGKVREATSQICDICGTPDCAERTRLVDDTAALADIFANLMSAPYLQLRLDVVTTNACRKFHIDALTARLICTYRGQGTQYGLSAEGTDPERVSTVPTGAPIVLRGTEWPESPSAGLLHRSPPIEGTGETRLVLVLDPISDPDEHAERHLIH